MTSKVTRKVEKKEILKFFSSLSLNHVKFHYCITFTIKYWNLKIDDSYWKKWKRKQKHFDSFLHRKEKKVAHKISFFLCGREGWGGRNKKKKEKKKSRSQPIKQKRIIISYPKASIVGRIDSFAGSRKNPIFTKRRACHRRRKKRWKALFEKVKKRN